MATAALPRGDRLARTRAVMAEAPPLLFGLFAGLMTFGTYFAMYAFRKPFAAAAFADVPPLPGGLGFKVALVIAQVVGYALAKFVGIRVVAETPAHRRIAGIALQIALAEAALIGFALTPRPWNVAFLFLDGLSLGMVWGLVFGFVEGRRQSDLIGAMLCATFVLASGVVKSVGSWVMLSHIASPFWMPAVTGLLFVPLLLVCLAGLAILPPPTAADRAERVERVPMDAAARRRFLVRHGTGLAMLVTVYVGLTALRDLRDNFAAEIWADVGLGGRADLFTWSELPTSIAILAILASLTVIRDNTRALAANFALVALGLATTAATSLAFSAHLIGPVAWMMALGFGLYLAYTPFNGMLFDRLVAATGEAATAGFLIYVADAGGYTGSVALLLVENFGGLDLRWAQFMVTVSEISGAAGLVLLALATVWFLKGRKA